MGFALQTFGGLTLRRLAATDRPFANSKSLLILAVLATRPGFTARRDELAELLWPGRERRRGLGAMRQALFHLSARASDVLARDDETLTLNADALTVDLWAFDRCIEDERYSDAIELYRGPFAAGLERKVGVELEHLIEAVNSRVAVALEVAYTREMARLREGGRADRAVELAKTFARLNPLDDERQRLLIQAQMAAGDRLSAVQTFEAYRSLLERDLGEDVPPELAERIQAIRSDLLAQPATAPAPPPAEPSSAARALTARSRRREALAAAAVIVVMLVSLTALTLRPRGTPDLTPLEGRLVGTVERGTERQVVEIVLRGERADVRPLNALEVGEIPSPDGGLVAFAARSTGGAKLAIRAAGSREARVLETGGGDEYPVTWSPDGRYVLYARRRLLADGRAQAHTLHVYDLTADSTWALTQLASTERPSASWSPDGTRIAFTADRDGTSDVFVVQVDGTGRRNVSRHAAWDGHPAWEPDGGRLAFVSRRDGPGDVYMVRVDGSGVQRLTESATGARHPRWISAGWIVYVTGVEHARDLWAVHAFTGQFRRLTATGDLASVVVVGAPRPKWIERLTIEPRTRHVSPGQHLALRARLETAGGEDIAGGGPPVTWSVGDRRVAWSDGRGRIQIAAAGRTDVIASIGGWRADTLRLVSLLLVTEDAPPALEEEWREGLVPERWRAFGDPEPDTRASGGPAGSGVLGRAAHAVSWGGVLTREAFQLDQGLTVEMEARLPFTGRLHQEFVVSLYADEPSDSVLAAGTAGALAEFQIVGGSGVGPTQASVATRERRDEIPLPRGVSGWNTYAFQLLPSGVVELVVNGRLHWRSPSPVTEQPRSAYVGLGLESFQTEMRIGRVRIFLGPQYVLPEMPGESGAR